MIIIPNRSRNSLEKEFMNGIVTTVISKWSL